MKKLAIIGASHFQNPLILKAKERGIETHVFAWEAGDVGENTADVFHPISITDKDAILETCRAIGIDGIASIGTDLGNITVTYVAHKLGLTSNSMECVARSTNKEQMRATFQEYGDPSPRFMKVRSAEDAVDIDFAFPIIVKPVDRSGSRGVAKVYDASSLKQAIDDALEYSFAEEAIVEEFIEGDEFSVESISWKGKHCCLAITEKFTTGSPRFIEVAHLEPARISQKASKRIWEVVRHALDSLGVEYGASHAEVKLAEDGTVKIVEIGSRMGGDCIGSDLVQLSSGYDFVDAVIDVALGNEPKPIVGDKHAAAAVRFVFSSADIEALEELKRTSPELIVYISPMETADREVVDSSTRLGYYIFTAPTVEQLLSFLPISRG